MKNDAIHIYNCALVQKWLIISCLICLSSMEKNTQELMLVQVAVCQIVVDRILCAVNKKGNKHKLEYTCEHCNSRTRLLVCCDGVFIEDSRSSKPFSVSWLLDLKMWENQRTSFWSEYINQPPCGWQWYSSLILLKIKCEKKKWPK